MTKFHFLFNVYDMYWRLDWIETCMQFNVVAGFFYCINVNPALLETYEDIQDTVVNKCTFQKQL